MRLVFDRDVSLFLTAANATLEKEGTVHSFILGQALKLKEAEKPGSLFARGMIGDRLEVAGLQTDPGRVLILSKASPESCESFAHLLSEHVASLPGVNGPKDGAEAFATSWSERNKCALIPESNLRMFELSALQEPRKIPGAFRSAGEQDEQLLFRWLRDFHAEAVPNEPKLSDEELTAHVRKATGRGQFFLWENEGKCVCLVGSGRETPAEKWIAPVYTPLELRGNGYASALVAEVSRLILGSGKKAVLFTDLENPTSNSIYQKIGYKPVADFRNFLFA